MVCVWSLRGKHWQTDQTRIHVLILTGFTFSRPSGFVLDTALPLKFLCKNVDAMLLLIGTGAQLRPSRPLNGQTLRSLTFLTK